MNQRLLRAVLREPCAQRRKQGAPDSAAWLVQIDDQIGHDSQDLRRCAGRETLHTGQDEADRFGLPVRREERSVRRIDPRFRSSQPLFQMLISRPQPCIDLLLYDHLLAPEARELREIAAARRTNGECLHPAPSPYTLRQKHSIAPPAKQASRVE